MWVYLNGLEFGQDEGPRNRIHEYFSTNLEGDNVFPYRMPITLTASKNFI